MLPLPVDELRVRQKQNNLVGSTVEVCPTQTGKKEAKITGVIKDYGGGCGIKIRLTNGYVIQGADAYDQWVIPATEWDKNFGQGAPMGIPQALLIVHPHGAYALTIMGLGSYLAHRGEPLGERFFACVDDKAFGLPGLGSIMFLSNAKSADRKNLENLFDHGRTLAITPGGVYEQNLSRDPAKNQVYVPGKIGFIELALKKGRPLMPVYSFGEDHFYEKPGN